MREINTPISDEDIRTLSVGEMIEITGYIYTGRDAVLPRLCFFAERNALNEIGVDLQGSVIFHTAVSSAGVGPTSSNKLEIEGSFPTLSEAGVKIHLGKGAISSDTIRILDETDSVYAVMPPVTALLQDRILESTIVAFPEEGMEAMHRLKAERFPAIIAVAHGKSIY